MHYFGLHVRVELAHFDDDKVRQRQWFAYQNAISICQREDMVQAVVRLNGLLKKQEQDAAAVSRRLQP